MAEIAKLKNAMAKQGLEAREEWLRVREEAHLLREQLFMSRETNISLEEKQAMSPMNAMGIIDWYLAPSLKRGSPKNIIIRRRFIEEFEKAHPEAVDDDGNYDRVIFEQWIRKRVSEALVDQQNLRNGT